MPPRGDGVSSSSVNRNWLRVDVIVGPSCWGRLESTSCVTVPYNPPGFVMVMRSVNTLTCTGVPCASGE